MNSRAQAGSVVLVPGAWADGSCWSNVILPLRRHGLDVVAAPIPLTSLSEDTAALRRVIERTIGPVILVGHAYAGAVISAVLDDRVKSLVYIAVLAPDEGETGADIFIARPLIPRLRIFNPIVIVSSGCPTRVLAAPLRTMHRRINLPSWLRYNGHSRCSVSRKGLPHLHGRRRPRGI